MKIEPYPIGILTYITQGDVLVILKDWWMQIWWYGCTR